MPLGRAWERGYSRGRNGLGSNQLAHLVGCWVQWWTLRGRVWTQFPWPPPQATSGRGSDVGGEPLAQSWPLLVIQAYCNGIKYAENGVPLICNTAKLWCFVYIKLWIKFIFCVLSSQNMTSPSSSIQSMQKYQSLITVIKVKCTHKQCSSMVLMWLGLPRYIVCRYVMT